MRPDPVRPTFAFPRLTPGVKLLLLVNTGVFVATLLIGPSALGMPLSYHLAVSWNGLWEYGGLGLLRLVTSLFAHEYRTPWHFLLNMMVLYFFGTLVESEVGKRGIIHLYLVGGVVGNVVQFVVAGLAGEFTHFAALGASGACYGILIYAACLAPRSIVYLVVFPIELRWVALGLVGVGVYQTIVTIQGAGSGGIANGAHLGGALYRLDRVPQVPELLPAARLRWGAVRRGGRGLLALARAACRRAVRRAARAGRRAPRQGAREGGGLADRVRAAVPRAFGRRPPPVAIGRGGRSTLLKRGARHTIARPKLLA